MRGERECATLHCTGEANGNATAGDPVGIYPHGWVPWHPASKLAGDPGSRGLGRGPAPRYNPGGLSSKVASKRVANRSMMLRR